MDDPAYADADHDLDHVAYDIDPDPDIDAAPVTPRTGDREVVA